MGVSWYSQGGLKLDPVEGFGLVINGVLIPFPALL